MIGCMIDCNCALYLLKVWINELIIEVLKAFTNWSIEEVQDIRLWNDIVKKVPHREEGFDFW